MADKSKCCNASVKVEGDDKEGTHYYVCNRCGKPCDIRVADNQQDNRNHKGEACLYKKILLCQEGYCSECAVYLEWCLSLWK